MSDLTTCPYCGSATSGHGRLTTRLYHCGTLRTVDDATQADRITQSVECQRDEGRMLLAKIRGAEWDRIDPRLCDEIDNYLERTKKQ